MRLSQILTFSHGSNFMKLYSLTEQKKNLIKQGKFKIYMDGYISKVVKQDDLRYYLMTFLPFIVVKASGLLS